MTNARPATVQTQIGDIRRLAESFEIALAARNLSVRTVRVYLEAVELLARYLDDAGMPSQVAAITREHLEAFLAHELERVSPTSVHIRYRGLQQFFRWAVEDGEITVSPRATFCRAAVSSEAVRDFER